MKTILISLILVGYMWTDAQAQTDATIEFCAATLIVAQDLQEYKLWKARYELDLMEVLRYQIILQTQLDEKRIPGSEIKEAAAECKEARKEVDNDN